MLIVRVDRGDRVDRVDRGVFALAKHALRSGFIYKLSEPPVYQESSL